MCIGQTAVLPFVAIRCATFITLNPRQYRYYGGIGLRLFSHPRMRGTGMRQIYVV
jgi:hypothetical protein